MAPPWYEECKTERGFSLPERRGQKKKLTVLVGACVRVYYFTDESEAFKVFGHQNIPLNVIQLSFLLIIHFTQIENKNMYLFRGFFFLRNYIEQCGKKCFNK